MFQNCKPWNPKAPAYGKFWVDVPGQDRQRRVVTLGPCATKTIARQRLREFLDRAGVNSKQAFMTNTAPATTFREQAETWIGSLASRRRKPVKPATIAGWQHGLDKWLVPNIGDKLLSEVTNKTVRELIEKMVAGGLGPKTIVNHIQVVKLVVASAGTEDGEQMHPRKWNHEFIGLPIVDKNKQYRPTVTEEELNQILSSAKRKYAVLFALMAGTGLRIGEALAVRNTDFGPDCRVLHVRRSVWRGREQAPKTSNAVRVVDIAEELAAVLRKYTASVNGYLFATADGKALNSRNVLHVLHPVKKVGFHVFRRYRSAMLRRARVPEDLIGLWLGHSRTLTDRYASQLREDVAFRTEWVERAGLGFSISPFGSINTGTLAVSTNAA